MAEINRRIGRLEEGSAAAEASAGQCSATSPHDALSWDRRVYRCRCGKTYGKDGFGGLREVDIGS